MSGYGLIRFNNSVSWRISFATAWCELMNGEASEKVGSGVAFVSLKRDLSVNQGVTKGLKKKECGLVYKS